MSNKEIVKKYLNKYFKAQYLKETDDEFKALVRILNKKDKQVKFDIPVVIPSKPKCKFCNDTGTDPMNESTDFLCTNCH